MSRDARAEFCEAEEAGSGKSGYGKSGSRSWVEGINVGAWKNNRFRAVFDTEYAYDRLILHK